MDKHSRSIPCNECQAGLLRLHFTTYFMWLGEELVTVPNFPAWVCDVCGRCEYDPRAVSWLTTMLNPETGKNNKELITRRHRQMVDIPPTRRPATE